MMVCSWFIWKDEAGNKEGFFCIHGEGCWFIYMAFFIGFQGVKRKKKIIKTFFDIFLNINSAKENLK